MNGNDIGMFRSVLNAVGTCIDVPPACETALHHLICEFLCEPTVGTY